LYLGQRIEGHENGIDYRRTYKIRRVIMARANFKSFGERAKKILVVDDESDIRDILSDVLTSEGFEVNTAENGAAALQILLKANYDLLITDLNMPQMDGIELLDRIYEKNMEVKTIIMSSFLSQINTEYAKRRRVSGCISKPQGQGR
jgi:CheY-like chemotaxis protein